MGGAMSSGLQSAMSNPMFYLGAQSLMQTPSVGRPVPNPFSMQNILAAQQMADAQKQRQFLPNLLAEKEAYDQYLTDRTNLLTDYSALENELMESEISQEALEEKSIYDAMLERGEINQQDYLEEIQKITEPFVSPTMGAEYAANVSALGPAPTNPLAPANIFDAMLTSGIPAYQTAALNNLLTPKTFTAKEGETTYRLNPRTMQYEAIMSGGPTQTNLMKNIEFLNSLPEGDPRKKIIEDNLTKAQVSINQGQRTAGNKYFYANIAPLELQANQNLPRLGMMAKMLESEKVQTGAFTETKLSVGKVAEAFGIDPSIVGMDKNQLATTESFYALAQQSVLDEMAAQKGPQTDKDFVRIQRAVPTLSKTPEANKFLIDVRIANQKYNRDYVREYRKRLQQFNGDHIQAEGDGMWAEKIQAKHYGPLAKKYKNLLGESDDETLTGITDFN